jgi:AbrB family looped-hinge helix DNA binding protein
MSVVKVLRHGQITLPKSLRAVLDIKEGDILEIELERSHLIVKTKILVDKENSNFTAVGAPPELPKQSASPAGEGAT